jgi:hypothetical protein
MPKKEFSHVVFSPDLRPSFQGVVNMFNTDVLIHSAIRTPNSLAMVFWKKLRFFSCSLFFLLMSFGSSKVQTRSGGLFRRVSCCYGE